MSEDRDLEREELERQLTAERELNARVHKHMGMSAAILGLVAMIVALVRIPKMFGVSPWETFGIIGMWLPLLLLILVAGVVFSLGTTRLMMGVEFLVKLLRGKKAGE